MQAPPDSEVYGSGFRPKKSNTAYLWIIGGLVLCGCGGLVILPAILFPVFMQARESAMRSGCLSNTKRIASAQMIYAADNDEKFPVGTRWIDATDKAENSKRIYTCPAVRRKGQEYGYAMNSGVGGKRSVDIENVAATILVFESTKLERNAVGDPKSDFATGRHGNGHNEAYCDGRAKWIKSGG